MRTLGLIPARGGSKGIPRKNVRPIAGKPLIAWTIEAALSSKALDAVVVSTEDAEIAEVARRCGAEVPFVRPDALAADGTPGIAPVLHALEVLPGFEIVVLLQPTSPLRTAADIRAALDLARDRRAPAVVAVSEARSHPAWTYRLDAEDRLLPFIDAPDATRRQDLPKAFAVNGAVYVAERDWLRDRQSFVGKGAVAYAMPAERSIDIDDELDWRIASMLLGEACR